MYITQILNNKLMNKFLNKLPVIGLIAVMCSIMSGCKPTDKNPFSVKIHEVGPGYVEVQVTAPNPVQIAYIVDTKEQLMNNPAVMFTKGDVVNVKPDDVIRIDSLLIVL